MLRKREFYGYQLSALFVNVIHLRYLEECEVADDDVPVLVPGVDEDSTPGCVLVQDDLSLTGVAQDMLEHPLNTGVLERTMTDLAEETDLTAEVIVKI